MSVIAGDACWTEPKRTGENRYHVQRSDKGCGNL
jgi:hypothetical protein